MAKQVDATSSSSLVEVATIPKATAITHGDSPNDFEVVVRVTAAGPERMKSRMPIDLVAVLDVSGSMGWDVSREVKEKRLELLKKAMYFIIKKLSPQDNLALVAFNGDVVEGHTTGLLPISGNGRSSADEKVKNLVAGGVTAFMPALKRAVKILDGRSAESKKERLGFIFLLTDGEDTKFQRNEDIDDRYPVHTFGLSWAADPRAMLYIAEKSHGTYSSVSDKITEAFARCLGGLQSVVAFDTHIQLTCKAGVKINRIESGNYDKGIDKNEPCGWIKVEQLYAGEEKNFIVYLNVPKAAADSNSSILLAAGGKCKRAPGQKDDDIGGHDLSVDRPKEAVVAVAASPVVVQQIVRLRLIHFFEKFRKKYEGMRSFDMFMQYADPQIPTNIKEQQKNAGEWLRKEWNKFKDDPKNWSDDEKNVLLNGGFDKDVDVMVDNLTKGLGQTYVLSWLSSYLMQRAADSDTFQTPSMKHLVEEAKKDPEKVEPTESTVVPVPPSPPAPPVEIVLPVVPVRPAPPAPASPSVEIVPPNVVPPSPMVEDVRARECAAFDTIELRLAYWYEVKRDLLLMFDDVEDDADEQPCHCGNHLTPVFHDESIRSINQAMYHDIYLAVEHASNLRRCYRERTVKQESTVKTSTEPPGPETRPQD